MLGAFTAQSLHCSAARGCRPDAIVCLTLSAMGWRLSARSVRLERSQSPCRCAVGQVKVSEVVGNQRALSDGGDDMQAALAVSVVFNSPGPQRGGGLGVRDSRVRCRKAVSDAPAASHYLRTVLPLWQSIRLASRSALYIGSGLQADEPLLVVEQPRTHGL